jgi:hypothetical protein
MTSKTQTALALMDADRNLTAYQAAKLAGITPTTLYNAIRRREAAEARVVCPCCGSRVDPAHINRTVLKDQ